MNLWFSSSPLNDSETDFVVVWFGYLSERGETATSTAKKGLGQCVGELAKTPGPPDVENISILYLRVEVVLFRVAP